MIKHNITPPPFSSAVLSEHHWGKLLSEEVLHKLINDFGHGQRTNDRGSCIENIEILQGGGNRGRIHNLRESIEVHYLLRQGRMAR